MSRLTRHRGEPDAGLLEATEVAVELVRFERAARGSGLRIEVHDERSVALREAELFDRKAVTHLHRSPILAPTGGLGGMQPVPPDRAARPEAASSVAPVSD
jgi:hypothetical protein